VQSAAAVGSFACGIDVGVKAVLDSGVLPHLLKMLQNGNSKVKHTSHIILSIIIIIISIIIISIIIITLMSCKPQYVYVRKLARYHHHHHHQRPS
jgi:type II secretory pathway component PulF